MAVFRRGKSWVARIYDPRTSRQVHVGSYGSRSAAAAAERAALTEIELDRRRRRGEETVGSFAARWVEDFPRQEESTNLHNAERVSRFAREFENRLLSSIGPSDARRFLKEQPGALRALRAMFGDAVREGLCPDNPFAQLRLPQSPGRRDITILRPAQVDQLVEAARVCHGEWGETTFAAMILCGAYVGLRPGELFELRWPDVDFGPPGRARIERALQARTRRVRETKNHQKRTVIVPPPALEALASVPRAVQDDLVFHRPRGAQMDSPGLNYYWRDVRATVGLQDMDFYELRHFCGSYLADRGVSAQDIAHQLGHRDGGRLAQELYIHIFEENALSRLDAAFG